MEGEWQARRRSAAMADGASLIAPDTVWFAWDTKLGRDVTIEPNVFFGPGVTVADGVKIRANSHIEGATIGGGCEIGPFARLRPGTILGEKAKLGNFVETRSEAHPSELQSIMRTASAVLRCTIKKSQFTKLETNL